EASVAVLGCYLPRSVPFNQEDWHKLYPKPTKYALHRNFRKSFARKSDHVNSIICVGSHISCCFT
ncbi:hypothetical protein HID58_091911, partial [Brassica napus]